MTLHLSVSRDRRQRLVRMHTAEHILFRSLQNTLAKSLSLVKISLGPERSSLYVRADSLGWGDVLAAERLANTIIWEDRAITHHEMSREEFGRFPRRAQVRINEQRVTAERLRIVEVADFDLSACMGTHCRSTGEVRSVYVLGFGQESDSWRIDFAADATAEMLLAAGEARNASARLGIPVARIEAPLAGMCSSLRRNPSSRRPSRRASRPPVGCGSPRLRGRRLRGLRLNAARIRGRGGGVACPRFEEGAWLRPSSRRSRRPE